MDRAVNNPNQSQAVSARDALRMCTYNGCCATFDEKQRGSLEAGKIADMAILSGDPYTVPTEKLGSLRVKGLLLGGKPYESAKYPVLPGVLRGLTSSSKAY